MYSVFHRHCLGHRRCGPEGFRHHRQKSAVVGYRIGAIYRVYYLSDIRVSQREKISNRNLALNLAAGVLPRATRIL